MVIWKGKIMKTQYESAVIMRAVGEKRVLTSKEQKETFGIIRLLKELLLHDYIFIRAPRTVH